MRFLLGLSVYTGAVVSPISAAHELETLFVQGRGINLVGAAVSASEGVVSQNDIRQRPLLRTGEVLELVPGMVSTQHSGNGKANQYFLRGFNLDHGSDFATQVNSMPINMRTHGHGQGYTDLNFIIPEFIDELAYKKGAYYAEVGDFSSAGSAHITTTKRLPSGFIDISVGEYGNRRFVYGNSYGLGESDVLIGFEHRLYSGPWDAVDEDLHKTNAMMSVSHSLFDGEFSATAMHYQNTWNSADQIPERAIRAGLIDALGSLDTTLGGDAERSSVNLMWNRDYWNASAYVVDSTLNLWSNFTYFLEDPINGDQFEQVDKRRLYGGKLSLQRPAHILSWDTEIRAGLAFRIDNIQEVGLYNTAARQRLGVVREDAVDQQSFGVFLESKTAWNSRLSSVLSARYDYVDFDVRDQVGVNTRGVDLAANSGGTHDDVVSLKTSLSYVVGNDWEAYISAGQGFHSNDARGVTAAVDPATGGRVQAVQPLVPSFAYEAGLRGFIHERVNTSVSLWALQLDSELVFVGDAGNTEASAASERYGIEFAGYFYLNPYWSVDLELALSDAKFKHAPPDANDIPGAIHQVVQAGLTVDFENGWSGSLRLRHFGERPLTDDGRVQSDGSSLWNMRAAYQTGKATFRLDILNLGNSSDHDIDYFYESRLRGEAGEGVADVHSRTLEPRSVRLSFTYAL